MRGGSWMLRQSLPGRLKESGHQLPKVPWEDCLARLEDLPRADHPTKDHLMEIYVERQYSLYKVRFRGRIDTGQIRRI